MSTRRTVILALSKTNGEWLDHVLRDGDHDSASRYLNELIAADRKHRWRDSVDRKLHAAINSGPATPLTRKDLQDVRAQVRDAVVRRQRRKSA